MTLLGNEKYLDLREEKVGRMRRSLKSEWAVCFPLPPALVFVPEVVYIMLVGASVAILVFKIPPGMEFNC